VKDPYKVLREKEQDVERVRKEIQALRTVIPLLADDRHSADNVMRELREAASRKGMAELEPFARHLQTSSSQSGDRHLRRVGSETPQSQVPKTDPGDTNH
jgi:uncharacterized protein with von Willebrand factor type A (vWA) domain